MITTTSRQNHSNEFQDHVEIIADRLYWVTSSGNCPSELASFNVDNRLRYIRYSRDFGPVSLPAIANFCRVVQKHISLDADADGDRTKGKKAPFYFHSSTDPEKRANAALLISCFSLLILKRSPEQIWVDINGPTILPFRDASNNDKCSYKCTILDCLQALELSIKQGWFSLESFSIPEFEVLENPQTGNMSIIIPEKIIACRGPVDDHYKSIVSSPKLSSIDGEGKESAGQKCPQVSSENLIRKLKAQKTSIDSIVRCNSPYEYDRTTFISAGINHFDLNFSDGSCPNYDIIQSFNEIVKKAHGYVVVHCKAGLGRTGTLIACYIMKEYEFRARQAIAWVRLCRSGSVLGKQQQFLLKYEDYLVSKGFYHKLSVKLNMNSNLKNNTNQSSREQGKENESSLVVAAAKSTEQQKQTQQFKATDLIICLKSGCFNLFRRQKLQSKQEASAVQAGGAALEKGNNDKTAIISPEAEESANISINNQDKSNVFAQKAFFTEEKHQAELLLGKSIPNKG